MERGDRLKIGYGVFLTLSASLGAGGAVLLGKYDVLQSGPKSLRILGIIGIVQNLVSISFTTLLHDRRFQSQDNNDDISWSKIILGHLLAGVFVVALTALAAKVNLISERLSVRTGALLLTASLLEHYVAGKCVEWIVD